MAKQKNAATLRQVLLCMDAGLTVIKLPLGYDHACTLPD